MTAERALILLLVLALSGVGDAHAADFSPGGIPSVPTQPGVSTMPTCGTLVGTCCSGSQLESCVQNRKLVQDCAAEGLSCRFVTDRGGFVCSDDVPGSFPAGALCQTPGCVPDCAGKMCGADLCGASCGACPADQSCDRAGRCAVAQAPVFTGADAGVAGDTTPSGGGGGGCAGGSAGAAWPSLLGLLLALALRRRRVLGVAVGSEREARPGLLGVREA